MVDLNESAEEFVKNVEGYRVQVGKLVEVQVVEHVVDGSSKVSVS